MATPFTKFDARQVISRDLLSQLFPSASNQQLDELLRSINGDLTFLLRLDASNPADRVVNVGPGVVANSETNRSRSIPHIQSVIPNFTGGTITFPAASGGTITVSPGVNQTLTLPSGQYLKVLISLDSSGNLVISQGSPNAVEANATVPAPAVNTLPIGYCSVHNTAGTIDNFIPAKIVQFDRVAPITSTGGGGGGGAGWVANSQPIPNGSDTVSISFASNQPDLSYIVLPMLENTVDPSPSSLHVLTVTKTVSGFTCKLNAPTDSNNFKLMYIVPLKAFHMEEFAVPNGVNSVTPVYRIPENGANYGLVAALQNTLDGSPQFQPLVVSVKSSTGFSALWNNNTDSGNYVLSYMRMATEEASVAASATSKSFNLPVNYGSTNYAVFACMYNLVDPSPQFQTLMLTVKGNGSFTLAWEDPTDSVNYKIAYYAISYA